ncbi:MAG: type VI-D CRISPR-associated RNA-guided ribonuclease Cas13d, partial [Lachnospiraceae bacterium]|nr:type VI-D CRISPR-associated RNA-guided ribonuclease Cas13d [Lachnospiraceae bacterium]
MGKKEKLSPPKKGKAKERKLEQNAKKLEKIKAAEAKKQEMEELLRAEEKRQENEKYLKRIRKIEADDPDSAKILKSKAKAAGVKSIFTLSKDKLLVTSFANGNSASREKYVEKGIVTNISDESVLTVISGAEEKKFNVSGRIVKDAKPDDPRVSRKKAGQDLVYLKEKHEEIFFGKAFEDNIHIQVAYNVLDISKILSVFANNIVYELNNMLRSTGPENDDLIGSIGFKVSYEKFEKLKNSQKQNERDRYHSFETFLSQPQLGYFGNTLLLDAKGKRVKKEGNEDKWNEHKEHCYYLLATLGMVRQATAHGDLEQRAMIYRLEDEPSSDDPTSVCIRNARKALDKIYSARVKNLNSKFFETSGKKDLAILFRALGADTDKAKQHVVQEYYRFIILKEHKNLGFSIKRLREVMISQEAGQLADEEYNTFRHKLNHLVDFLISQYYK